MSRLKARGWRLALLAATLAVVAAAGTTTAFAGSSAKPVRVAIMTDCKGAFAFGFDVDTGGAMAAFAQYAGGKAVNPKKPSAGMTGIKVGNTPVKIVGIGCGNDTVDVAAKETRRLMEQLKADVMIGPLSGDEAVYVANYAKTHPTKLFVIGTAGSQDPTLQIAPKNVFRYHGDGAQWNAGSGDIAYNILGWRKAAIIMDDYSFGWTSAAGFIADFCAAGGQIVKRVFPPLNTTDYSSYVQQLPPPDKVDGYFWVVGGSGTSPSLTAFEQAYGKLDPKKVIGNLFFAFLGADKVVAPKFVGAYVGGFGTPWVGGLKTKAARAYEASIARTFPGLDGGNYADGFVYNYYNAAWAFIRGLKASGGEVGAKLSRACRSPTGRPTRSPTVASSASTRTGRRSRTSTRCSWSRTPTGSIGAKAVGFVPLVDQSFGGLFKKKSPPPGRSQPPCVKRKLPWQGKIQVVKDGVVTKQILK